MEHTRFEMPYRIAPLDFTCLRWEEFPPEVEQSESLETIGKLEAEAVEAQLALEDLVGPFLEALELAALVQVLKICGERKSNLTYHMWYSHEKNTFQLLLYHRF